MITSMIPGARVLRNSQAGELYLTLSPALGGAPDEQARELYARVRDALAESGARIFAERVFATAEAIPSIEASRATALGELADEVPATRIAVERGACGELAGVQIHAVAADRPVQTLYHRNGEVHAQGRGVRVGEDHWLMMTGLCPGGREAPGEQARRMFDAAGGFLQQAGADMRSVIRTWLWLKDVCDWYGDLNTVRTTFFKRTKLIHEDGRRPRLPASTGIGLGPAAGGACAMDLIALSGGEDRIEFLEAGGEQESAFAYGSAFSRAAVAPTPGGRSLFISGTAAIDPQGRTEHVGQIDAQIASTVRHVRALMAQAGCGDAQVLSALAYCKTPEVEQAFAANWGGLEWPVVSMIGDVCRPDLLFEVELVAGPVPDVDRVRIEA